jgi:hypothetical protein
MKKLDISMSFSLILLFTSIVIKYFVSINNNYSFESFSFLSLKDLNRLKIIIYNLSECKLYMITEEVNYERYLKKQKFYY